MQHIPWSWNLIIEHNSNLFSTNCILLCTMHKWLYLNQKPFVCISIIKVLHLHLKKSFKNFYASQYLHDYLFIITTLANGRSFTLLSRTIVSKMKFSVGEIRSPTIHFSCTCHEYFTMIGRSRFLVMQFTFCAKEVCCFRWNTVYYRMAYLILYRIADPNRCALI